MRKVITNVHSNAINILPDGGKIIFSIDEKDDRSKNVGCYEFTIEDNGIGMTKRVSEDTF